VLNDNISEALAELRLPPFVFALPDGDDGVTVHVEGKPFGFRDDDACFHCDAVRYDQQYAADVVADHILNVAADIVAIAFQASVRIGSDPWQQRHGERTITVNPAPVSVPAPIVNVRVEAPVVNFTPPELNLPQPVVNIAPAQINLPAARRVRKRVVRDRDSGLMLGVVEEDEPDAG
jgi:hypothetical protein